MTWKWVPNIGQYVFLIPDVYDIKNIYCVLLGTSFKILNFLCLKKIQTRSLLSVSYTTYLALRNKRSTFTFTLETLLTQKQTKIKHQEVYKSILTTTHQQISFYTLLSRFIHRLKPFEIRILGVFFPFTYLVLLF